MIHRVACFASAKLLAFSGPDHAGEAHRLPTWDVIFQSPSASKIFALTMKIPKFSSKRWGKSSPLSPAQTKSPQIPSPSKLTSRVARDFAAPTIETPLISHAYVDIWPVWKYGLAFAWLFHFGSKPPRKASSQFDFPYAWC